MKYFLYLIILIISIIQPVAIIAQVKQPNIVFILVDDMGWTGMSVHSSDKVSHRPKVIISLLQISNSSLKMA